MKAQLSDFAGGFATEEETRAAIGDTYRSTGYVMDTHTAVASHVYETEAKKTGVKTLLASTASPYKFARSVMESMGQECDSATYFDLVDRLAGLSGVKVPQAIEEIRSAGIIHDTVCDKTEMEQTVRSILGLD